MCSRTVLLVAGHRCRVSYPYDAAIDVSYTFSSANVPPESNWAELDARFRQFLKSLLQN
jgi:hypothetical protein